MPIKLMSYTSLQEAHKSIWDKNWNSFFSKIASKYHNESPVQLGVFYYFREQLFAYGKTWNAPEIYSSNKGWRSLDVLHENIWEDLKQEHPELPKVDWMSLPRGRVYFNRREFVVELDKNLESLLEVKEKIISRFGLPPEGDHYQPEYRVTQFVFNTDYDCILERKDWE